MLYRKIFVFFTCSSAYAVERESARSSTSVLTRNAPKPEQIIKDSAPSVREHATVTWLCASTLIASGSTAGICFRSSQQESLCNLYLDAVPPLEPDALVLTEPPVVVNKVALQKNKEMAISRSSAVGVTRSSSGKLSIVSRTQQAYIALSIDSGAHLHHVTQQQQPLAADLVGHCGDLLAAGDACWAVTGSHTRSSEEVSRRSSSSSKSIIIWINRTWTRTSSRTMGQEQKQECEREEPYLVVNTSSCGLQNLTWSFRTSIRSRKPET